MNHERIRADASKYVYTRLDMLSYGRSRSVTCNRRLIYISQDLLCFSFCHIPLKSKDLHV